MATKAPPSPWYTSRTLWSAAGIVLLNLLAVLQGAGVLHLPADVHGSLLALGNSVLGVLAIVFRWQAGGPLSGGGGSGGARPLAVLCCALLPLGLLSMGCVGSAAPPATSAQLTPAQQLWRSYGEPLKVAATVYEDTLREAGALHARGHLTDEQLEQVRKAGHAAEAALRLARSALSAYLAHQTDRPPSTELFAAQSTISSLLQVAAAAGVSQ